LEKPYCTVSGREKLEWHLEKVLSKSQYIRGLQCHKSLWLYKNKSELRTPPDEKSKALFRVGDTVGDYAKNLFPGGTEIEFDPTDFNGMTRCTRELIVDGVDTLYEATFREAGIFAMADILHKTDDGWDMYEVKASTSVKPYHLDDASVQWYALSQVLGLNRAYIVHVNNQYERHGDIDVGQLLTIEDVTEIVQSRQTDIPKNVKILESMVKGEMPEVDIGPQCSDPYDCDFRDHCWAHVPEVSIFNLYRLWGSKKFDLYDRGILSYADIPEDYPLNEMQQRQVASSLTGEIIIDPPVIRRFLDRIQYPISFFDFETFQNPIPRFEGQRPYMQMPFQYSLHVMDERGGLSHHEFLGDHDSDPRRDLCESMLRHLPSTGSIVAYNQSFEIGRIRDLAGLFPDLEGELMTLIERFVDLVVPFREGGYYHPDFNGSFSIKSVLPAMFPDDPELSYKSLNIQDGGMASDTFANLYLLDDPSLLPAIRQDLLAYCKLDTLAMVRIWEKLKQIAGQ
jgi:hypothetical protein